jgi:hypothetical protein
VEFDDKAVCSEQGGANDLAGIMEPDRRAREIEGSAGWDRVVPRYFAVLNFEIAEEWNQEPTSHGIDKGRAALDRVLVAHVNVVEGFCRHRLEPAWNAQRCWYWWRQLPFKFGWTSEFKRHGLIIRRHGSFSSRICFGEAAFLSGRETWGRRIVRQD